MPVTKEPASSCINKIVPALSYGSQGRMHSPTTDILSPHKYVITSAAIKYTHYNAKSVNVTTVEASLFYRIVFVMKPHLLVV